MMRKIQKLTLFLAWKLVKKQQDFTRDNNRQKDKNLSKNNIFGYGASARKPTFTNFAGIDNKDLKFTIDQTLNRDCSFSN